MKNSARIKALGDRLEFTNVRKFNKVELERHASALRKKLTRIDAELRSVQSQWSKANDSPVVQTQIKLNCTEAMRRLRSMRTRVLAAVSEATNMTPYRGEGKKK